MIPGRQNGKLNHDSYNTPNNKVIFHHLLIANVNKRKHTSQSVVKSVSLTSRGCRIGHLKGLVSRSKAPQQVRARCRHGSGPLVHLLRGDVVIEQRLPVFQGRRVGKAPDEVGVRVRRIGCEVARQVVGRCV